MSKRKTFNVLSIDGGGIRGIIPAIILETIETMASFTRICELFDLIAGTSTGGLIALALTKPNSHGTAPEYTASSLVQLYQQEGMHIFDRSLLHSMRALGGLADQRYPTEGIERILDTYFEETLLSEAFKADVLIPSYDMEGTRRYWRACQQADPQAGLPEHEGGYPRFFKSRLARDESRQEQEDYLMKEVARATSAAPTYFEPLEISGTRFNDPSGKQLSETLVDGGVFANNPAMCAYVEAREMLNLRAEDTDILLVSIGTGSLTRQLQLENVNDWGALRWVPPLFRIIADGASDTVDHQVQFLLPNRGDEQFYYRFQPRLTIGNDDMDDSTSTNLYALQSVANDFVNDDENMTILENLVEQLMHNIQ